MPAAQVTSLQRGDGADLAAILGDLLVPLGELITGNDDGLVGAGKFGVAVVAAVHASDGRNTSPAAGGGLLEVGNLDTIHLALDGSVPGGRSRVDAVALAARSGEALDVDGAARCLDCDWRLADADLVQRDLVVQRCLVRGGVSTDDLQMQTKDD